MFESIRQLAEKWLRIPPAPEPPPGDESSARVFRAAPTFLRYLKVLWAIKSAFLLLAVLIPGTAAALGVLLRGRGEPILLVLGLCGLLALFVFVIVPSIASLALIQLDYERRWYLVTDSSLRIREGVFTVKEITFTFANIQNLSVTQGPVQRWLGIADLKVETAGGGGGQGQQQAAAANLHTAYFRGIDNADEVKELIARRLRVFRDSGLGDSDDPGPEEVGVPSPVDALREVLDEARGLRQAVARR